MCLLNEENVSSSWSVRIEPTSTMKTQLGNNLYVHNCYSNISAMLQDDIIKLDHLWLTSCSRIAVQLRISEKMLLNDAEAYVKQRVKTWRGEKILDNEYVVKLQNVWWTAVVLRDQQTFCQQFGDEPCQHRSRFVSMWTVIVNNYYEQCFYFVIERTGTEFRHFFFDGFSMF
jgi:hypothetical protein